MGQLPVDFFGYTKHGNCVSGQRPVSVIVTTKHLKLPYLRIGQSHSSLFQDQNMHSRPSIAFFMYLVLVQYL